MITPLTEKFSTFDDMSKNNLTSVEWKIKREYQYFTGNMEFM